VSGDSRFDRVIQIRSENCKVQFLSEFIQSSLTLVAGSSWSADEDILKELLEQSKMELKMIIAPHIVAEEHINELLEKFQSFHPVLFSTAETADFSKSKIMIIDTIGQLSYIYRYANIAYVGGGFGSGIHNILEAATYGIPVIFGPNYQRFNEAIELIELGAAFPVENAEGCIEVYNSLAGNKDECLQAGKIAREYVDKNGGATGRIIAKTREFI
jgi:3-deoxy-D-manno-octulosonic-acid transferase